MSVKKRKLTSVAPVTYKKVQPKTQEETTAEILKNAGIEAENSEKVEKNLKNTTQNVDTSVVTDEIGVQESGEGEVKKPTTLDELLGSLEDIEDKFEGVTDADYYEEELQKLYPSEPDYERLEVPEIDESAIKAEVEESEKGATESAKNTAKLESEVKKEAKEAEIEAIKESAEDEKKSINEIYDEYKVNVENDAIKRGLARSSVALLQMDNVESSRAEALSNLAGKLSGDIQKIESEIINLQEELEITLNNLDLELAGKINEKIAEKVEKLEKKRAEAIEFNNKVSEMEVEYGQKRFQNLDEIQKMEEELKAKYEGVALQDKTNQKLELAFNYFKTMDKREALKVIINSPELASALGNGYYDLYYYVMRR